LVRQVLQELQEHLGHRVHQETLGLLALSGPLAQLEMLVCLECLGLTVSPGQLVRLDQLDQQEVDHQE